MFIPIVVGVPWGAGRAVASARAYAARLAEVTRLLVAEQERTAELVRLQERTWIARELHDVVAHSVGVITLQAAGARRVIDRDVQRATAALDDIEGTARGALADLERAVSVLRTPAIRQAPARSLTTCMRSSRGCGIQGRTCISSWPTSPRRQRSRSPCTGSCRRR